MENNQPGEQAPVVTPAPTTEPTSTITLNEQTVMAALSYVSILVLIPFFLKRHDSFVRFHIKQGIVLLVPELMVYVASGLLYFLWPVWNIVYLIFIGFMIVGILNALTKKEKALPFIGHFAEKITVT